ncbi:MAG: hypothetical protein M1814_005884 [Vezdaea aestivalis]|nr:MAG: hypothetical protein M1814_005884 [Vezdaea aestivalis]
MSHPPWDYIAKLVCIGDSGTDTDAWFEQLTIRLCEGRFSPHHDVTIGVEFGSRIIPVGPPASIALPNRRPPSPLSAPDSAPSQKHMKLSLWDTAGQETYASVTRSYFRGASGALLVFSLTRRSSFEAVTRWLEDLRQIAEPDIVVVLVGNKLDLVDDDDDNKDKREVSTAEAKAWCEANGVLRYVETSAKSGEGVEIAFREVAEKIHENIGKGRYDLSDRRSGVKGPGAGGPGRGGVRLGMNDSTRKGQAGWGGGCC